MMSCRHAGNSKVKELIKPTVYSTTLQKSPNSVRAGEFVGIWPVMSDTNGFSTELNREVNEVAAIEQWGPVELGVEFSNTKIGTFDGEKGKYKWPYLSHGTLALEVNRECAARVAQFIYRRTNKVKEVTKRPGAWTAASSQTKHSVTSLPPPVPFGMATCTADTAT